MRRQLSGLFTVLALANATLADAAWACMSARERAPVVSEHAGHMHGERGRVAHGDDRAPAPHRAPCGPHAQNCCGAFAPCGHALAISGGGAIGMVVGHDAGIAASRVTAPASRLTSPDPPPPKA